MNQAKMAERQAEDARAGAVGDDVASFDGLRTPQRLGGLIDLDQRKPMAA
jgi:hypothetical protein